MRRFLYLRAWLDLQEICHATRTRDKCRLKHSVKTHTIGFRSSLRTTGLNFTGEIKRWFLMPGIVCCSQGVCFCFSFRHALIFLTLHSQLSFTHETLRPVLLVWSGHCALEPTLFLFKAFLLGTLNDTIRVLQLGYYSTYCSKRVKRLEDQVAT